MSTANKDFFIGWLGNTSDVQKRSIQRLLIPVFVAIPLILFVIVFFAKSFGTGVFELGKVKEFSGTYYDEPFPVLILDEGPLEAGIDRHALLVGFGKHGAKTFTGTAEKTHGKLHGKRLKIQGTLIYSEEKTLIELTKKEQSILSVEGGTPQPAIKTERKKVSLQGEILDPKCWFGVMKPAEGKVHKSCAIRCISGGIPPVFRHRTDAGNVYYVLKGLNGEDINHEVLGFVGEGVKVNGNAYEVNGWKVLEVDPTKISYSG
ncbi:MAG: hypothetical protein AAGA77_14710 [Bacteroidota bacterium]